MKTLQTLTTLLFLTLLSGCLDFGEDIELKGELIDIGTLEQITQITGVAFPKGTVGKNYFFLGSGIDDALWLRASIPEEKRNEFLKNEVFSHADEQPNHNMTLDREWWRISTLKEPSHHSTEINQNTDFLGCSIGIESGEVVVYLLWFST